MARGGRFGCRPVARCCVGSTGRVGEVASVTRPSFAGNESATPEVLDLSLQIGFQLSTRELALAGKEIDVEIPRATPWRPDETLLRRVGRSTGPASGHALEKRGGQSPQLGSERRALRLHDGELSSPLYLHLVR